MHSSPLGRAGGKDTGGMSTYLRELAAAMGEQGHRVDLFTRVPRGWKGEQSVNVSPGARLVHIEAGSGNVTKSGLYCCIDEFSANLDRFTAEDSLCYDLICSHYWLSGCAGRILERRWNVPQVIMFHTLGALKNATGSGESEPPLRLREEKKLARECRLVIAPTAREKEALARRYGAPRGKIRVIPCGVNTGLFRPLDRGDARARLGLAAEKLILHVGRIEPVKGADLAIEALARLPDDISLLIVGGDDNSRPAVRKLGKLARKLGAGGRVRFQGLVEYERLPLYYSAADVTVISSYYESFGLVALESLSCGTPVVSTDVGGMRDFIRPGETGYLLGERSPEMLTSLIELCLRGKEIISPPDIRRSVTGLAWPRVARLVEAACREAAAGESN